MLMPALLAVPPDSCVQSAAALPFGGMCPGTELECPPCPWDAPVKCPSGGCAAHVRECHPNVFLRGNCDSTTCEGVNWCHILPRMHYACWEQAPSTHNATLTFSSLDDGRCGTCLPLISRYRCTACCGRDGVANWAGSYATTEPDRSGGGVFMHGSRWVCILIEVARQLQLDNPVADLVAPVPPSPSPPPPPPPRQPHVIPLEELALSFPMPDEYDLE